MCYDVVLRSATMYYDVLRCVTAVLRHSTKYDALLRSPSSPNSPTLVDISVRRPEPAAKHGGISPNKGEGLKWTREMLACLLLA